MEQGETAPGVERGTAKAAPQPLSDKTQAKIKAASQQKNVGRPIRLRPDEWKSGEIAWIVAAEGDPRVVAGMLQQIRKDKLGGRAVKVVVVGEDGGSKVDAIPEVRPNIAEAEGHAQ